MRTESVGAPDATWEVGATDNGPGATDRRSVRDDDIRLALLDAMVAEVAEVGYDSATVENVCTRAGVDIAEYHALFADKQAGFLAACDALADALLARASAALQGVRDWETGVRVGLDAVLTYLAGHAAAARACMIEGLAAGPEALAIRDLAMRRFAELLDGVGQPTREASRPSPLVSEASVGGIYGIVIRRIRDGQASTLPDLLASLSYFLLAPVVGCPRARLELAGLAP